MMYITGLLIIWGPIVLEWTGPINYNRPISVTGHTKQKSSAVLDCHSRSHFRDLHSNDM